MDGFGTEQPIRYNWVLSNGILLKLHVKSRRKTIASGAIFKRLVSKKQKGKPK
jgi:hypothetical protein